LGGGAALFDGLVHQQRVDFGKGHGVYFFVGAWHGVASLADKTGRIAVDKLANMRYTTNRKGAAGQTVVSPGLVKEVTACLGSLGGYFFFIACGSGPSQ